MRPVGVVLVVLLIAGCEQLEYGCRHLGIDAKTSGTPPIPKDPDADFLAAAKQLLEDHYLSAPATAKYQSTRVVSTNGTHHIVHVVVDAQNNFGALLRKSLCVAFSLEGENLRWSKDYFVQECSKPPTEDELAIVRRFNWPAK